jgi:hypothetical protein
MINKNDGNIAEALNCLDKILKNQEAPNTLKKRIEILYNHIKQTMENN